ncbi:hypothetical protein [Yoonia vestfoldensis]|uniref:hypothetical protein n=1 Tax=Yoonia vestfoldensis TaxID=245188 RepID=UPI00036A73F1|nr:hypothetical protein [Yoonia vestfoldensis]
MRYLILTVLVALLPLAVVAQPVAVQTGEHADFSRVVVRLPAEAEWGFGRSADGYVLRLPVTEGYDLRRFFDLIPKTRITAVSQDAASGELRLAVSCICRADVFFISPRFLVIDIADGPADPASPFEQFIDGETASSRPSLSGPGLLPIVFPDDQSAEPALPVALPLLAPVAPVQPIASDVTDELDALERLVIESLGRGLTTGVLEPDIIRNAAAPVRPPQVAPDLPLPGISVTTGIDRAALPADEPPPVAADGTACVPNSMVDLAAWADDRSFGDQIAAKRSALVQEFDRLDPDVILGLARLYLHFGFGREAIQTLELDGAGSMERTYLRLLAQIIDDDPISFPDVSLQLSCSSDIALWAFLATPVGGVGTTGDRAAILRAFKDVPPFLQRHLGPRLAERFAAIGDDDAADQALRMARRDAPDEIDTILVAATLAARLGDDLAELETLTMLARTDPRITAEAMIRFLVESARQKVPVPDADMITADALRFEHAATPLAEDIAAAQIGAYLAADVFADTILLLDEIKPTLDAARFADLQMDIDLAAVARMPDAEFLAYIFARHLPEEALGLREDVAQRLLSLGFPDQALRVLGPATAEQQQGNARYLRAAALLDLNDPDAALRVLRDDATDRASDLRAVARSVRAGNATPTSPRTVTDDIRSDWRSGNWAGLADADDPLIRDTVAAVLNTDGLAFDDQAPLASGRALLDDAAQSRILLDGLLDRFMPPDDF